LVFLKYWPSSHYFNKLVIKTKIHAKTYIFWICFVWKYNMIFFFYLWETWSYALKQYFFCFIIFCNVSTKTGYFNTGFVSLQYKNTNHYFSLSLVYFRLLFPVFLPLPHSLFLSSLSVFLRLLPTLCLFSFFLSFFLPSLPYLCSPLFFFPFISFLFQSRLLLSIMSLCFFFFSPTSYVSLCPDIYRDEKGERGLLPLSSKWTGVGWLSSRP
jgi:hypothetical protein